MSLGRYIRLPDEFLPGVREVKVYDAAGVLLRTITPEQLRARQVKKERMGIPASGPKRGPSPMHDRRPRRKSGQRDWV